MKSSSVNVSVSMPPKLTPNQGKMASTIKKDLEGKVHERKIKSSDREIRGDREINSKKIKKVSSETMIPSKSKMTSEGKIVGKFGEFGEKIQKNKAQQDKSIETIHDLFQNDQQLNKLEAQLKIAYEKYTQRKKEITDSTEFKKEKDKLVQINKEMNSIINIAIQHFEQERKEIMNHPKWTPMEKQKAIYELHDSLCKNLFTEEECAIFNQLLFGMGRSLGGMPMICQVSSGVSAPFGSVGMLPLMMISNEDNE